MNKMRHILRIGFATLAAVAAVIGITLLGQTSTAQAAPSGVIQSMIDAASDGGTVSIPAGTYTESLTVNKTITLTGVSSATTIIRAVTDQRVITVTSGHTLRLENMTLTGGQAYEGGGVYASNGSLQIVNCLVAGNSASYGGGVFQGNTGRVDAVNSRIERNHANVDGGGFYINGDVALTDTQVLTNTANRHGGGLHVGAGRADVLRGLFAGNQAASGNGGGINLNKSISLSGTQLISNTAGQDGGGLLQWDPGQQVNVTSVRFERNQAARNGGGLCVSQGATTTVTSGVFISNTVDSATTETHGGGAYVSGSTQVLSSTFRANKATCSSCGYTYGGGLYNAWASPFTVQDSLFESNYAWLGGGLHDGNGFASIRRVTFSTNSAGYGGAVHASNVTIENSRFMHNDAERRGGGLEAWNGAVLVNTRFISNTAQEGGGLSLYGSSTTMVNTVIVDNQASLHGSGLYVTGSPVQSFHATIARNTSGDGSGVYADYSSNVAMANTILANQAAGITATSSADVVVALNGVLWYGNTANIGSTATAATINVTSAITGTPAFAADGYHLTASSMAIDHGVNSGVIADIDGEPRPTGAGYDIGADEYYHPALQVTKQATPNPVVTGKQLTYTICVTNTGNVTLTATITDVLPGHVTPAQPVIWTSQVVPAFGGVWKRTLVVTVEAGYTGLLTNTVQVTAAEGVAGSYSITVSVTSYKVYLPLVLRN